MKILVTGVKGQLGYEIVKELKSRGYSDVLGIDREEMDITNENEVNDVIESYNPSVIFHCAAWTQVDLAEDEYDKCYAVNVDGTKNIALAANKIDAKMFYISTDYVFDGTKDGLYEIDDEVNPRSVYGETKYLGEKVVRENVSKHFITRISWVFGINGNNFIKTMLKLADFKNELNIVDDQVGSPTYTFDLAKLLVDMAETTKYGIYHATNSGFCSWATLAEYVFKIIDKPIKVNKVSTEEYLELTGTKQAYRPRNSKLSKQSLVKNGFENLPDWKAATKRYIKELKF